MRFVNVAICFLLLATSCARPRPKPAAQPPTKPTEIRAVWVSDTPKLNWDEASRQLQRAGFNTMYVNFASGGAAFYPKSRSLPSTVEDDAVARGVALARQRGIEVHAKLIVMFMFKAPPEFQKQLIRQDRVMRGPDGKPQLQSGFTWLCPSRPENLAMSVATIQEMLGRYPVAGLQFDYIRFYEEPTCYCKSCRQASSKFPGGFSQWRQQLITEWVRQLSAAARQARPGTKISAAIFPDIARAREEKAQDWRTWLERGYVDYVCPMNYTLDAREFEQRCRQAPGVIGIASWKMQTPQEMQRQIEIVRRLGMPGFALFSYDDAAARGVLPALH